jgi:hypothetical protein
VVCTTAVLLFYTICGFFIFPLIARVVAVKQLSKQHSNQEGFAPVDTECRAKCFDEALNFPKLSLAGSMTGSVAVAGASASDQKADERTHTEGDANGLLDARIA